MTISIPIHGGGAQPVSSDTSGKTIGRVALRAYGFPSEAAAIAEGYRSEAGPAMSVYVVSAAQLASGAFVLDGDPKAIPVYAAPAGMKVEGGYSQPIYVAGGSLGSTVQTYTQKVLALGPIAYWPLNEPVGTTGAGSVKDASGYARHATPTAVTFGATGIGDGGTAADFDGATSLIDLPSAFKAAYPAAAGTVFLWVRIAAPVWTDSTYRWIINIGTGLGENLIFYKSNGANICDLYRKDTGSELVKSVNTAGNTAWLTLALTWDKAVEEFKPYYNGIQSGVTQGPLGTWAGSVNSAYIGSNTASFHKGQIAHVAVFDKVLSASEILGLSSP